MPNLPVGTHCLVDGSAEYDILNDMIKLEEIMKKYIIHGGATILGTLRHKFEPHGCTIIFLLSESHASIHTYPEYKHYMLDIFTCGNTINTRKIMDNIIKDINSTNIKISVLSRY